jgi:FemAB family protein
MNIEDQDVAKKSIAFIFESRDCNKWVWDEVFKNLEYKPVSYTNSSLDYRLAYHSGLGENLKDLSVIIFVDNAPVALWPLSILVSDGVASISSMGHRVLPPLFVAECNFTARKNIVKSCIDFANKIARENKIYQWESGESFNNSIGLSPWHIQSLRMASACSFLHELYVDLRPAISEIKNKFRKSYKSLILPKNKLWRLGVLDSYGDEEWREFQMLHRKVSGRVTRSSETWDLQYHEIKQQRAFLVWLRNEVGAMIGGGLFNFTSDEGLYAVGAYDHVLVGRPLGHIVQYRAIEELKKRGVSWYRLGLRPCVFDNPKPTDKELNIGDFKQGFCSHIFPHYRIMHRV